ncbi:MAG: DUF4093 domain-containing protein [Oscillospiraceae bacterium]|nr:DUF4093 domain-containing protein [Oscillospiraceae bacterium]
MEKLKIKEAIVVEGRYDKNTLSQVVDAVIIETSGFGIFSNKEKLKLLRDIAEKRGLIVFTDSDSAGFMIRNHIKGAVDPDKVKQAYIPDIMGKEKRKRNASKEGKLGVEGMRPEVIRQALVRAGATIEGEDNPNVINIQPVTKTDFFCMGLSGGAGSAGKRQKLIKALGLPERLSADALLDIINALYTKDEFETLAADIFDDGGTEN